jgi:hypothetical protein
VHAVPSQVIEAALDHRVARPPRDVVWRRVGLLWPLSVIAAAVVTASVTYGAVSIAPVPVSSGAQQIATLKPLTTQSVPTGFFGTNEDALEYEFHGVTLVETAAGYGADGNECFAAVASDQLPAPEVATDDWSIQGMVYSGCRVGSFPATIEMKVDTRNAPEQLRAQFPHGGALQFVLGQREVGVFLDAK